MDSWIALWGMIKVYWFDLTADRVKNKTKKQLIQRASQFMKTSWKNIAWICLKILSGMLCWFREVYNSGTKACASHISCLSGLSHPSEFLSRNMTCQHIPEGKALPAAYSGIHQSYQSSCLSAGQRRNTPYSAYCSISPLGENVKWCQLIQRDS